MEPLNPRSLSLRQRWSALGILAAFFLLYASISLVNHFMFRTYAWDMAYFNKAIFDYSELRLNEYDFWGSNLKYTLGDHFEPIMFLIAPLRYLFGQYTLMLVQIGAILFGGYGAFVFVKHRSDTAWLPHLALIHYLSIWGTFAALAFDYHNNVVGAMFVPWVLHYFGKSNYKAAGLFFLLLLMSKENMALWGVFIGMGLALHHRKDKRQAMIALGMAVASGLYFIVVMKVVLPAFQPEGVTYKHFRYSALGTGFGDAIKTVLTKPLFVLETMWYNHGADADWVPDLKQELYKMMLLSGGWALFLRPQYFIMAVPIVAQKVFSDKTGAWGINNHYCIELVPLLSMAAFGVVLKMPKPRWQLLLGLGITGLTFATTFHSFENRHDSYYRRVNQDPFYHLHWEENRFNLATIHRALALIPEQAPVSATNSILSHLSMRDKAYIFPKVADAEYAVVLLDLDTYPSNPEKIRAKVDELKGNGWLPLLEEDKIVVLRKSDI